MQKIIIIILTIHFSQACFSQPSSVLITEQTIKVGKNKEFFYGLSEGDELVFDLKVIKGKNLKEVEIIEYPNSFQVI